MIYIIPRFFPSFSYYGNYFPFFFFFPFFFGRRKLGGARNKQGDSQNGTQGTSGDGLNSDTFDETANAGAFRYQYDEFGMPIRRNTSRYLYYVGIAVVAGSLVFLLLTMLFNISL